MTRSQAVLSLLLLSLFGGAAFALPSDLNLTPREQRELDRRLHDFYTHPEDPAPMNRYVPKAQSQTGEPAHPSVRTEMVQFLNAGPSPSPLLRFAGIKATDTFRKHHEAFVARHRSKKGHAWASVEDDDRVGDLTDGFIDVDYDLSGLPTSGDVGDKLWSDDYWRIRFGGTSYRYGEGKKPKNYEDAIAQYEQPAAFNALFPLPIPLPTVSPFLKWSPAEKYDLTVGDTDFTLTNQQKELGSFELNDKGDVEAWMGICDGWATGSLMSPAPVKPADVVGANGLAVHWYPDDIRAMVSLSWAGADFGASQVGGRCEAKDPKTFSNGRLMDQECFDTNPATLHLALANMIGRAKVPFIIDSAFDYEVWNQPMKSYHFTYFNPLDPSVQNDDWSKVAVDYDNAFKRNDRFQHPLTRGRRLDNGEWDDANVKKIVGVIATVVYLDELDPPSASDTPAKDKKTRVTYTYDLELHDVDGTLVPKGGEWHENTHPDFLWVPDRDSIAVADGDASAPPFTGTETPSGALTGAAASASGDGQPLCHVVKALLKQSAEHGSDYSCGD